VHACLCACMHTFVCTCIHGYVCMHVCVCVSACVRACAKAVEVQVNFTWIFLGKYKKIAVAELQNC